MSSIWDIHEYLRLSNRCCFDGISKKYTIKNDNSIDPRNVGDGFFKIVDDNLYALVWSEKGPIFIYNKNL